ncbi:MAG: proline/glycine betaine ABC transporter permease [Deltaproteobacteria bacterium]|nr:MAG: proline/glycine betaine ABC transporter permease [Deltaproteobacteria bacterium]
MEFPIRIPFGKVVEQIVVWMTDNFATFFDGITATVNVALHQISAFLLWVPWPVTILVFMVVAWRFAGRKVALITGFFLFAMGAFGLWEHGMKTLALVATSVLIAVLLGIPLGIVSARNDTTDKIVRPIMDGMQTIPSFVYLIPAVMFFGIGNVPGVMATVIFALPPMVRLTNLGIRQVSKETVEAGKAFGCTEWQLLTKIQIPLALPAIMAGVNQTVMMALSMVVIAAMIGAGGLGSPILYAIQRVELGIGVEAGLGILFTAIILDRILQGYSAKQKKARHL